MDQRTIEKQYLEGGATYLKKLQGLGLDPEGCFWAFDEKAGRMILMIMTSAFDVVGPLEISKVLFKAYEAAVLPEIIDPFMVQIHSPQHTIMRALLDGELQNSFHKATVPVLMKLGGTSYSFLLEWIYKFEAPKTANSIAALRSWHRFEKNVDKLAA